ncbi:MAG: RICIN domain-containing protein [Trebonia sp.]
MRQFSLTRGGQPLAPTGCGGGHSSVARSGVGLAVSIRTERKGQYMPKTMPPAGGSQPAGRTRRWRRALMTMLISVAILLGFGFSSAPGASASTSSWTGTLHDAATGRCLDSNSSGSVYTLACNGGGYQRWSIVETDSNNGVYMKVIDWETGRCLDSNSSGSLYTLSCNGGAYQNWDQSADLLDSPVTWVYVDRATGLCLDSNSSGSAYTHGCNFGSYQKWIE